MKDAIIDLIYNWKHSMSKENTKGTRFVCILVFVLFVASLVVGIPGLIIGIIKHHAIIIVLSAIPMAFGIGFFVYMSTR